MSLGLLGGYGSASGSEISDSEGEEEEEETTAKHVGTPRLEKASDAQLPHAESLSCDKVTVAPTTTIICSVEDQSSHVTANITGQEELATHSDSSAVSYYGLDGGSGIFEGDSSSSPESDEQEEHDGEEIRGASPLPLPELDGSAKITASVFSNPYREAEEAKLAVLKQHVDLSQHVEPSKKQRKWAKKRGKYRHTQSSDSSWSGDQYWNDRDSPMGSGRGGMHRKHRSGVGESLEPPKKYMKIHQKIQSKERPWTTR